ncbi:MAG: tRNA (adenosine(37)-N6)-threonylcarbamoyltransferase complex transferase subunit TsaD [Candidatus Paceibacterota bacterium]
MRILAIETSCDETAIALTEAAGSLNSPRFKILKSSIASQIKIHRPFGGVVPSLAKREHQKNLPLIFKKVVSEEDIPSIDLIAVTVGPGLEPALWQGIAFAKEISKAYGKPLLGVNHLEGHIYSNWINPPAGLPKFPAVSLIVSGGHTILSLMKDIKTWKILGSTRDDAVGEAFDKVARMLKLPYPGGPEIERLAKKGKAILNFPSPMLHSKDFDFSFAGLKTAVLYYLLASSKHNLGEDGRDHKKYNKEDVCASFQSSAFEVLIKKTLRAAETYKAKSVLLSGGVASSRALRALFKKETKRAGLNFFAPGLKLNTDNAAMISAAAYISFLRKKKKPLRANGNMEI